MFEIIVRVKVFVIAALFAALLVAFVPQVMAADGQQAANVPDNQGQALSVDVPSTGVSAEQSSADTIKGPGVLVSWNAPKDLKPDAILGYNIYRSDNVLGHYEKVNSAPVKALDFEDRGFDKYSPDGLELGKMYYYKITTEFSSGGESGPSEPVGMEAGGDPGSEQYMLPQIEFFTSDAVGKVSYLGDTAVFILKCTPGLAAWFSIPGVTDEVKMEEVQPGTYKGSYTVQAGVMASQVKAVARVEDAQGGRASVETPSTISLVGIAKPALKGLYAGIIEADRIGLNWPRFEGVTGRFAIYRDTRPVIDPKSVTPLTESLSEGVSAFIDTSVAAGQTYYYVLGVLEGGTLVASTDNLKVVVPEAGKVSGIDSVQEDSDGRTLVPGDILGVVMDTDSGGKAMFSLGDAVREVGMTESEPGVYKGSYTVREGDGVFKSRVTVSFRAADSKTRFASSATFVSVNAPRSDGTALASGGPKPVVTGITDDIQTAVGISGRLVAGKTFTVTMTGDPGNKAFFSIGDSIWKVPMQEQADSPGTYVGSYTVRPGDNAGTSEDPLRDVYVTGYLQSPSGALSEPATNSRPVIVDTSCDIKVEVSDNMIPADARSQSRVTFTVTDADGEPVKDRRLTLLLEPPPKYTGVVGGGGMNVFDPDNQDASNGNLGKIEVDFDDMTDDFGQIKATYTSGFAAKTAVIVARDYSTGSVGMGYITTELTSSVSIALVDPSTTSTVVDQSGSVYQLVVNVVPEDPTPDVTLPYFMVNAIPDTLTADGRSRATVVATLTKDGLPAEGKNILFAVSGAGGSLTSTSATTDSMGRAQVFYIAGTRAGRAIITATEAESGASVTKTVTLLADAPARIYALSNPDTLPADGISTSDIIVSLTDVNGNPTEGIKLNFDIPGGSGYLSANDAVTDIQGSSRITYTAGITPGVVTVNVTALSEPMSPDDLEQAMDRVVAPMVYDFSDLTELVVKKWYRSIGDRVGRGEPLALVSTPLGDMKVYSPVTGTLEDIVLQPGMYVMEGSEIGVVSK
jgi:Bacterial Ig-like domain (group 1)/Biotin-requiring enzyme